MVRLSLIVLGLLAAAWCSTADAKGMFIVKFTTSYTQMSCGTGQVIKIGKCHKMSKPCPGPTFSPNSVKCGSYNALRYIEKTCNLKQSCKVHSFLKNGPYACQFSCIRRY